MKICQILASHGDGGLEKHVRELSIALSEHGHEVSIMAPSHFFQTLPENNTITKITIPARLSRNNPWLLWTIYSQLKKCQPDIIHAQANKAVSILAKLKPFLHTPCIGTLHNIKKHVEAFGKLDHIIAVSKFLASRFSPSQVTTVYNGIQLKQPTALNINQLYGLENTQPTVVAVGRLVYAKGFDLLLEAVEPISVNLVIIGDGPEKEALENQIRTLKLSNRVKLAGFRKDVIDLMNASDGIVISSRREGFSYVFNEALLLNKPILATNVPVANELLPPHLIVQTDDVISLRKQLIDCIENLTQWQQTITNVHHSYSRQLSLENMCQKTLTVYSQALSKSSD